MSTRCMDRMAFALALAALASWAAAAATPGAEAPVPAAANTDLSENAPQSGASASPGGLIGAGDILFVEVFRRPELSTTAQVDGAGNIMLPENIGSVHVAGMSEIEASGVVTQAYLKLLRRPRVTVSKSGGMISSGSRTAEMKTEIIELKNSDAESICTALQGCTTSGGKVSYDPDTNTLIVTDTAAALVNIMNVINKLDAMENQMTQVRIEAKLAEVQAGAMKELGLRWFVQGDEGGGGYYPLGNQDLSLGSLRGGSSDPMENERIGASTSNNSNYGSSLGRRFVNEPSFDRRLNVPVQVPKVGQLFFGFNNASVDIGALLDALAADNKAELLASPNTLVVNHKTAEIKMTEEFPYVEYGTEGLRSTYSTRFIDLGIKLVVTPHVYQDDVGNYVKLDIGPEVSYARGMNNGVPIRAVRSAHTVAKVRDGQTLVVGGIYSNENRNIDQAVPGIGKLPVIGRLFKHSEKSKVKTELMVFVTPTVHAKPESVTWDRMLDVSEVEPAASAPPPLAPANPSRE